MKPSGEIESCVVFSGILFVNADVIDVGVLVDAAERLPRLDAFE